MSGGNMSNRYRYNAPVFGLWVEWVDGGEGWAWILPEEVAGESRLSFAIVFVQIPAKLEVMREEWLASEDVKAATIMRTYLPVQLEPILDEGK